MKMAALLLQVAELTACRIRRGGLLTALATAALRLSMRDAVRIGRVERTAPPSTGTGEPDVFSAWHDLAAEL